MKNEKWGFLPKEHNVTRYIMFRCSPMPDTYGADRHNSRSCTAIIHPQIQHSVDVGELGRLRADTAGLEVLDQDCARRRSVTAP
jgi:hypothetical protein